MRRRRARWLRNQIENDMSEGDNAENQSADSDTEKADSRSSADGPGRSTAKDAPDPRGRWPTEANPSTIVSSSVGVGSRGASLLVNAPYLIQLDRIAGPLVRELGYERSLSAYWEAIRAARAR
jgi:hypothetical protein